VTKGPFLRCAGSAGRGKQFAAASRGVVPESNVDSEFIGYERGAFSGRSRSGKAISRGTLFLGEIGETPLGLHRPA
jgi:DNA-binding NtrC family response regulator